MGGEGLGGRPSIWTWGDGLFLLLSRHEVRGADGSRRLNVWLHCVHPLFKEMGFWGVRCGQSREWSNHSAGDWRGLRRNCRVFECLEFTSNRLVIIVQDSSKKHFF